MTSFHIFNTDNKDIDQKKFKEYFGVYKKYEELIYEETEHLLDAIDDIDRTDFSEFEDTLDMVLVENIINGCLEEQREHNSPPYTANGNSIPDIKYIARLLAGCLGINFGIYYRFHPETFDNLFSGKIFVITGKPYEYGKKGANEIIENFGGVVRGAASGKTDYILVGDYAGEKNRIIVI